MAKFVLAGKADCTYYAKAELLADTLQRSLPNCRVHKIPILPDDWEQWLDATCKRNGWKHEGSPLVWRELVERGGKGMLLGGFSDFLDHCKDYYGITSDMPTEMMLRIAAENLETQKSLVEEEKRRLSLIQPLHVWITGALSSTSYILIPHLLSAEVFPKAPAISLHLLQVNGDEEELEELKKETEELAFAALHQVTVHTDLDQAFQEAEVILLLDDFSTDRENESEEENTRRVRRELSELYREYGRLIDVRAKKQVKVIVSGDSFINLRCSLLVDNASSIDSKQFVAPATQLENEARAILAEKMNVRSSDVTDVIVWGNISSMVYIDLQRARAFNYDGAIKGPAFFSQPVHTIVHDRKWLETEFQHLVRRRRAAVASMTGRAPAVSSANGILRALKVWNDACSPDEVLSVGICCPGIYNLPDDIVLSLPVTVRDGEWSLLLDVDVGDELKERLKICANELQQDKELGLESCTDKEI